MEALYVPFLAQISAHALIHVALLIPPSTMSHQHLCLAFLPPILACNVYTWNAGFGFLAIAHSLWAVELVGFRRVREDFVFLRFGRVQKNLKIVEKMENGKEKKKIGMEQRFWREQYPETLWKRIPWVINLTCSLRYTGWETSPTIKSPISEKAVKTKPSSRSWFWVRETLRTALCLAVIDAISLYTHFDPYFQIATPIGESFPRRLRTFLTPYNLHHLPPQFVRIFIYGLQQYALSSLLIPLLAIPFVTLGGLGIVGDAWGGTQNWRPCMGSPMTVWRRGLRGFWGGFCHQIFRNILTGPGKAITKILRIPETSLLAYILKIVVAFAVSSVLQVLMLQPAADTAFLGMNRLRYASFFWIHGGLISVETIASNFFESLYPQRSRTRIQKLILGLTRLMWVGGVMYLTAPLIVDEATKVSRTFGLRQPYLVKLPGN